MTLEEFLGSLGYIKEDIVRWSFMMKNLICKESGGMCIWTKDEYAEFIKRLSKPEVKKKVFLKLINVEEDKKEDES